MAYRSPRGPVRFAAWGTAPSLPSGTEELGIVVDGGGVAFVLATALGGGDWEPFARVRVTGRREPADPPLHVDAVRHGLPADGPIARMRRPAYAQARHALGDHLGTGTPAGGPAA